MPTRTSADTDPAVGTADTEAKRRAAIAIAARLECERAADLAHIPSTLASLREQAARERE